MSTPIDTVEDEALNRLGAKFLEALEAKEAGRIDDAEDALRAIIAAEPRLGEPHLELARLMLDTDRVNDAEAHAREAVAHLEATGVWLDEVAPSTVQALAHATLAEALRRRADEDDVLFGDPATFHAIVAEARQHFEAAHALDPSDAYSSYHAFFLGIPGTRTVLPGEAPDVPEDAEPGSVLPS
jgi:tetratricopeptide (TPR) repeat protein